MDMDYSNKVEFTIEKSYIIGEDKGEADIYYPFIDFSNKPYDSINFKYKFIISTDFNIKFEVIVDDIKDLNKQMLIEYNKLITIFRMDAIVKKYLVDNDMFADIISNRFIHSGIIN